MPNDNEQDERTILENLQEKMLQQTQAVAFVNSLFPDQMDKGEAPERKERSEPES